MKPTQDELELAKELVIKFINSSPNLLDGDAFLTWVDNTLLKEEGYWWQLGTTKICLGHKDLPKYIIKIGYTFCRYNFAELEFEKYQLATEQGLDKYFPYTDFLINYDGFDCFIQRKAEVDKNKTRTEWNKKQEEAGVDFGGADMFSKRFETIQILFNNQELLDFLDEYRIGDFHELNFGFVDENLVIIDFSGCRKKKKSLK